MYEVFFGFKGRPFGSAPRVDQYFPGAAIEAARQTLARCIERAEGVGMVVGPSGTGKTLLCQVLAEQFRQSFAVAMLKGRLSTRRALLQAILYQLGQPYREMDEGELRLALVDYLSASDECKSGMLLLVDEAHSLPLRLMEEIRMIGNLVCDGQPRIRTVLVGGPVLEERFASPKLESFSQRLIARCYLESFNRSETEEYIRAQIDGAGGAAELVFPPEACKAVYQATDGIPRLINQVCDHALLLAYAGGHEQISAIGVEEAWADLQQLPTPWTGDSQGESESTIIEFGGLDDELPAEGTPVDESPADELVADELATDGMEPEQAAVLPPLRVRQIDDEEEDFLEPAEQLEQIEETLSAMDEEFKPAGSIGPEMELSFDEPPPATVTVVDPFGEAFEEEEEIVSVVRVASPAASTEPEQFEAQSPIPEAALPDEPVTEPVSEPAQVEPAQVEPEGEPVPDSVAGEPRTVPMQANEAVDEGEFADEDNDLIVLEDACHQDGPRPAWPVTPVRRQEYRQLFSKLRRG